jgi:hypothetical protein
MTAIRDIFPIKYKAKSPTRNVVVQGAGESLKINNL